MLGRKLALVRNGQTAESHHSSFFVPDLQKIKNLTLKGTKRAGYILIFWTLKFSIKSSSFSKKKWKELSKKVKAKFKKNKDILTEEISEKQEVSKFLKMISDYKHKVRKIKHQIEEEEGIE